MVLQTSTIARNTFVESIRQPIYLIIILLCGIMLLFTTWGTGFSMGYSSSAEVSGDNKLLLDVGLATVFVCGMLLSAFVSTAAVSREIENKTVLTVVSKPISRTSIILGKYLGVATAMVIAVLPMLIFLLMGIRHGVMSTATDDPDQPVIVFTTAAVLLSLGLAAWCNFFYGWPFTQSAVLLMVPLLVVAYLLVLVFGKEWKLQVGMLEHPIMDGNIDTGFKETRFTLPTQDFKPQILLASSVLAMSMLVLSAVAVTASTRLGQVMTIMLCCGVFVGGLLSNYLLGRHAYSNRRISVIDVARPVSDEQASFRGRGDTYEITLKWPPRRPDPRGRLLLLRPEPRRGRPHGPRLRALHRQPHRIHAGVRRGRWPGRRGRFGDRHDQRLAHDPQHRAHARPGRATSPGRRPRLSDTDSGERAGPGHLGGLPQHAELLARRRRHPELAHPRQPPRPGRPVRPGADRGLAGPGGDPVPATRRRMSRPPASLPATAGFPRRQADTAQKAR